MTKATAETIAETLVSRARTLLRSDDVPIAALQGILVELKSCDRVHGERIDDLEARRREATIDGDRDTDAKLAAEIDGERFDRNQCDALYSKLSDRLERAQERACEARRLKDRKLVEQRRATAKAALDRYQAHVDALRGIIRDVAEADRAAADYARSYPDEPPFPSIESEARRATVEPTVVDERTEWAWIFAARDLGDPEMTESKEVRAGRILSEDLRMTIEPDGREPANAVFFTGGWSNQAKRRDYLADMEAEARAGRPLNPAFVFRTHHGTGERVWPGKVARREYAEPAVFHAYPMAAEIKLPAFQPGCLGWSVPSNDAHVIFAALDASAPAVPMVRRIERTPISDVLARVDPLAVPPAPSRVRPQRSTSRKWASIARGDTSP